MSRRRVLFINENIGGHATVHHHLRTVLADSPVVEARFLDVPPPSLGRRIFGASVPGLGSLDADLQPIRAQLALSAWVRCHLKPALEGVDLIHLYTQNAGLLSVGALRSRPTIVTLDTTNAYNGYRLPHRQPTKLTPLSIALFKPIERRVFSAAEAIVANSSWAAKSLIEDYGLEPTDIDIIPFGVVGPATVAPRTDDHLPRIVFVGRQFAAKGGQLLLDVFNARFANRAELILVTKDQVPTRRGVTVVNDLDQGSGRLWDILASADIFAFPSAIDQAPNAVLEAMAAGLPVIAVSTAAVPEMVVEGETGYLFAAGDADGLGQHLERLVDDGETRRRLGTAGRARFEERYEAFTATERLLSVFDRVASDARPTP